MQGAESYETFRACSGGNVHISVALTTVYLMPATDLPMAYQICKEQPLFPSVTLKCIRMDIGDHHLDCDFFARRPVKHIDSSSLRSNEISHVPIFYSNSTGMHR